MAVGVCITNTDDVQPVPYHWGAIKWVLNNELAPECHQSVGVASVLPKGWNPEHSHDRADETIYMLEGVLDCQIDGGDWCQIRPGQTMFIPRGLKHSVRNTGWEPVLYVAFFTHSFRDTHFTDPEADKRADLY